MRDFHFLDEATQAIWKGIHPKVRSRIEAEIRIPEYDLAVERLESKRRPQTKLQKSVSFAKKVGYSPGTIDIMIYLGEVRYIKYKNRNYVPETEIARMNGMPEKRRIYSEEEIEKGYGLSSRSIEDLVKAGALKRTSSGISGSSLHRVLQFVSDKKYEKLGAIPKNEWKFYTLRGKRLEPGGQDPADSGEENPLVNRSVMEYFGERKEGAYCCILYQINDFGTALFYIGMDQKDLKLQGKFMEAGKFYGEYWDNDAKCAHFHDSIPQPIGIIHSGSGRGLRDFSQRHKISVYLSNMMQTNAQSGEGRMHLQEKAERLIEEAFMEFLKRPKTSNASEYLPLGAIMTLRDAFLKK